MKRLLLGFLILYGASFAYASGMVTGDEALASSSRSQLENSSGFNESTPHSTLPRESASDSRTWYNVKGSRSNGAVYRNNTSNPIIVAVTPIGERWEEMATYVNGMRFSRIYSGDFGGGATITMEVPVGASYQVRVWNHRGQRYGIYSWLEFR